ncbi:MAG TPA: hypothetical protein VGF67_15955 [Ktedonobacteraceae bacterium]
MPGAAPFLGNPLTYLCFWFLWTQVAFQQHQIESNYAYGLALLHAGSDITLVHGYLLLCPFPFEPTGPCSPLELAAIAHREGEAPVQAQRKKGRAGR